jgi:16S rRNA (cytidine1402-2'-O)-methyltransferase
MTGRLTVVPTPIGNLGDMTTRAIEVLRQCDGVLAEDTRTTGNLLKIWDIQKPMKAFHLHNEHRSVDGWVQEMGRGKHLALCSDAGTPGISDPGFLLVRACIQAGIEVDCLPGATAFVPALVLSGFPCDRFIFEGFLPPKKGRTKRITSWLYEPRTIVCYESPHRLVRFLGEVVSLCGPQRPVAVVREISKLHQEVRRGTAAEVLAHFTEQAPRGEIAVVIGSAAAEVPEVD